MSDVLGTSLMDPTAMAMADQGDVTGTPQTDAAAQAAQAAAQAAEQQTQLHRLIRDTVASPKFDRDNGAPALWVATVNSYSRPDQKLQVLRDLQAEAHITPDAVPYGDNYIYTDPRTKRPTLFEPGFLTAPGKNIAGWAGMGGEMLGAGLGALGGAALGAGAGPGGAVAGGIGGAGAGGAAGREIVGAGLRGLTGVSDPRSGGEVASDVLTTAALNAAGQALIPGLSAVGRAVTPTLRRAAEAAGPEAAAAAAARGTAVPESQGAANLLAQGNLNQRYGTNLQQTAGMLSGSPAVARMENITSALPASRIPERVQQSVAASGSLADRIAMDISAGGGVSPAAAAIAPTVGRQATGDVMHDAAQGVVSSFENTERTLRQQAIDQAGGPNKKVPLASVMAYAQQSLVSAPGEVNVAARQAALNRAKQILGSSDRGYANLDSLLKLRTDLGQDAYAASRNLGDYVGGSDQYLRGLRDAVNEDLRAPGVLPDSALSTLSDHDSFVQASRDPGSLNLEGMDLKDVSRMATIQPDALAQAVINGNPAAGRKFANLYTTLASQNPDQARNLLAVVFRNLGAPTGAATGATQAAQFSPVVFATNWAKMPASVKTLFNAQHPELAAAINDFATAMQGAQRMSKFYNYSESGNAINWMGMIQSGAGAGAAALSGNVTAPLAWIGTYFGMPRMVEMMQNPKFVRWAAGAVREANAGRPGWAANAAGRLAAVGLNPADHQAIARMLQGNPQGKQQ